MKSRRLSGEAYWRLQSLLEKGEKKVQEYQRWAREECRKLQLIPDLADLVAGVYYDNPMPRSEKDPPRKPLNLISAPEVIGEANQREIEISEINAELNKLVRQIAMKLNIWPDRIDPRTGEIKAADENVESVVVDDIG